MSNGISELNFATINGLQSLSLDDLTSTDINTTNITSQNIDGNYFSIETIEANDVKIDNELELTSTGFISIDGGNITVTDTEVGYISGVTSNIQTQLNSAGTNINLLENSVLENNNRIDANETDIATNTTNISTNTTNIATNTTDIGLVENSVLINNNRLDGLETKTQHITADISKTNMNSDVNFKGDIRFDEGLSTYGRMGRTNPANDSFHILSEDNIYIYTPSGYTTSVANEFKLYSTLEMNSEIQNYAFTDARKTQIETNTNNIVTNTSDISTINSTLSSFGSAMTYLQFKLDATQLVGTTLLANSNYSFSDYEFNLGQYIHSLNNNFGFDGYGRYIAATGRYEISIQFKLKISNGTDFYRVQGGLRNKLSPPISQGQGAVEPNQLLPAEDSSTSSLYIDGGYKTSLDTTIQTYRFSCAPFIIECNSTLRYNYILKLNSHLIFNSNNAVPTYEAYVNVKRYI